MGLSAVGTTSPTVAKFAAALAVQKVTLIDAEGRQEEIEHDPVKVLARPTAKVAAKWVPESALGPEAELGAALALTFGPVIVAVIVDIVQEKRSEPKNDDAEQPKEEKAAA